MSKKKQTQRYKEGDTFKVEVALKIIDIDYNDDDTHPYLVSIPELEKTEWISLEYLDDLVNPTAKLIRLQKEREELDKQIEETKKRLEG